MVSKKQSQKQYLKGSEDIQRTLEVLADKEKQSRRAQWIKDNYNKDKDNSINNLTKGESK